MLSRVLRVTVAIALLLGCETTQPTPKFEWSTYDVAEEPRLGSALPQCRVSAMHYVAASAQTWPACHAVYAGITYIVGVDAQGEVRFIETSDSKFVTPEGLRVGSSIAQLRSAGASEPWGERGWGHQAKLSSGWSARFADLGEGELPEHTVVMSFFKR
jgi:DNA-binding helix-hairpin-helix protein with protein kinase domain